MTGRAGDEPFRDEPTVLDIVIDACAESVRSVGIGEPPREYAKAALRALLALPVEQRMEAMGMRPHTLSNGPSWEEAP